VYVAQPAAPRRRPVPPGSTPRSVDVGSVDSESADVDADGPTVDDATTVSGISTHGTPVAPEDVPHVDLVVAGSVGVTTDGARIGKGEGYSDLEWGVLSELGAVDREAQSASGSEGQSPSGNRLRPVTVGRSPTTTRATTVATTVHELSVLDGPESPIADPAELPAPDAHDVPLDLVVTPERTIRTETPTRVRRGSTGTRSTTTNWPRFRCWPSARRGESEAGRRSTGRPGSVRPRRRRRSLRPVVGDVTALGANDGALAAVADDEPPSETGSRSCTAHRTGPTSRGRTGDRWRLRSYLLSVSGGIRVFFDLIVRYDPHWHGYIV